MVIFQIYFLKGPGDVDPSKTLTDLCLVLIKYLNKIENPKKNVCRKFHHLVIGLSEQDEKKVKVFRDVRKETQRAGLSLMGKGSHHSGFMRNGSSY